jgi:hypothetical protein
MRFLKGEAAGETPLPLGQNATVVETKRKSRDRGNNPP